MLELYHSGLTTCSKQVRHCLREKGLTYESRYVDLLRFEHLSDAYLRNRPPLMSRIAPLTNFASSLRSTNVPSFLRREPPALPVPKLRTTFRRPATRSGVASSP